MRSLPTTPGPSCCGSGVLINDKFKRVLQNWLHVVTAVFIGGLLCWGIIRTFQSGLLSRLSIEADHTDLSPTLDEKLAGSSVDLPGLSSETPDNGNVFYEKAGFKLHVNTSYRLRPRISDWDDQRRRWLSKNPHKKGIVTGKSPLFLVSSSQPSPCENPMGDHFLLKAIKNKMDYCRLHGIDIFYNMAQLDPAMVSFWVKLPLVRAAMVAHPEAEWIWWMDSDALFTDMAFELPLDKYSNYNMVVHGWERKVFEEKSWVGLNMGVFLIRNCQWSLDLLDAWAAMGATGPLKLQIGKFLTSFLSERPENFEADDQGALIYLLNAEKERWRSKVYLESSYYLHGFWVKLVDKYEEMRRKYHPGYGDDRWPFVTHFVGCELCSGDTNTKYSAEKCRKNVEKAFNLADDQILKIYGFHHQSLQSSDVLYL
ncbi:hypothetical protein O6H91_02G152800 [Diphasiastrum complanatum]|uniref:Uncharacterized protein n=5 Tax=Diphasiastrum complanatum TaxID=34168 RepID=A0ACC2EM38_DIPCM|nr:hypothetical protein O6H91_02G151900 [Diphasiastrum complanatum]KAJ7567542.1 hypothetical protein O6H91_02G151900 [Diphasiastrum complanatum]KAJ7567543.1 hypothetical protein O6H91_02G151900 [Diphasiastrum complanatum]KAJ7567544.1 hypothetical protein O6H91_02G151900 [Diphasiastrum complanatum]KAJ7567556.1 hypothetical protein O6H91_02G152800 [Diphasiastrum complanatum]